MNAPAAALSELVTKPRRSPARWPRPTVVIAGLIAAVLVIAVIAPGVLASQSPIDVDLGQALSAPSTEHLLGTDQLGRDIFSRLVFGARYSILMGLSATALAVLAGTVIGLCAALAGRRVDTVITRSIDIVMAFPGILLSLLVIAILGQGVGSIVAAIAVAESASYARLVRSQAVVVRNAEYVRASVALGRPPGYRILHHIVPNSLRPTFVLATLGVGSSIMIGSALSFLGLGPKDPTPEWGSMLAAGRELLSKSWWAAVPPGAAITLTVITVTVLGRALRQRWEVGRAGTARR
ncbi:ABC transporter permease [Nocardia sp. AG03]|uniref:ABC transporter permease n=1 Tax=Nocardia sp. AG03 TaxID=3025312 RepID=UPI002418B7A6|nr:ABC transporter permease [Nocardia sp. AG03]